MYQFINFYSLLDIDSAASADEIVVAFNKEAKLWHPGRYPGLDGRKVMQDIIEAKRVLLDPTLRTSYDIEYYRLKAKDKLPLSTVVEPNKHDMEVLLNEITINAERYKVKKSAFGNNIIDNPQPNVSDNQLLHVIQYAYSYKKEFKDFAIKELLKRNYSQEFIDDTIDKSSHLDNGVRKDKKTINKWGIDFIAKLINRMKSKQ